MRKALPRVRRRGGEVLEHLHTAAAPQASKGVSVRRIGSRSSRVKSPQQEAIGCSLMAGT